MPRKSSNAVFAAIPQNSQAYSTNVRSLRARAENRAAISMPRGKTGNKKLSTNGKKIRGDGVPLSFQFGLVFCHASPTVVETRRRRSTETNGN